MEIIPLLPQMARQAARLHMTGISLGFLSSMGIGFLTLLYKTIAVNKFCFCYATVENENVLGYVAFTENLAALYKEVLKKNIGRLALIFACQILSWKKIKGIWENVFYPQRIKNLNLPPTALLSIVVSKEARKKGLGKQLIEAGFQECRRRGIKQVRVLAAEAYTSAHALYTKCGFKETHRIVNHGVPSIFYVADLTQVKSPAVIG